MQIGLNISLASVRKGGTSQPVFFDGTVIEESNGQSNIVGTNNIDSTLSTALQGQFDRVYFANQAWLGDNLLDLTLVHRAVETGETIDGVAGKVTEYDSPNGISHIHGMAVDIADTTGSGYLPDATKVLFYKDGNSGTPQTNWIPDGGGFNGSDAMLRQHLTEVLTTDTVRVSNFTYGQGEADAQTVSDDTETAEGVTTPSVVIPAGIDNALLTGFATAQANTRRAKREYFGISNLPYIILGVVLPDRGSESYDDNAERFREVLTTQYKNLARYAVTLSGDEESITVTDLGAFDRSIAYDSGSDTFSETVTGTLGVNKDNRTYWIDARGWDSPDSLHHGVSAQLKMGKAKRLLLEHIYGTGGVPPSANEITEVKPIFYAPVTQTSVSDTTWNFEFMPSEATTLYVAAYASGSSAPTAAQVKAGTGAVSSSSYSGTRRTTGTGSLGGLTAETDYDIYSVLEYGAILGAVPDPALVTTTEEVTSPWTLVGSTTAQIEIQGSAGDTETITLPGTPAENDVVLVFMAADTGIDQDNPNEGVSTSGYAQKYKFTGNPGAYFGWKRMGSTPDTSIDIYDRDKRQSVVIQVWRGGSTSNIFDVEQVEAIGNSATPDPGSLTTVNDNALRMVVGFMDDDDASTVTAPSGYTNLAFTGTSLATSPGSQGATVMVASKDAGTAGAEDPGTFTTNGDDSWRVLHIALRPNTAAAFDPATLFTSGEEGVVLDTANSFTDTAGTTAATTGDAIARITDLSGNGNHVTQAVVAERPDLTADGSLDFDGVDDSLTLLSSGLGSDMTAVFALKTTDGKFIIFSDPSAGASYIGANESGSATTFFSASAGTPVISVSGVDQSSGTRGDLNDAIATGGFGSVSISNMGVGSWSALSFSDFGGFTYQGEVGPRFLIIDRDLTAQEQFEVEAWIMEGLT